jgi:hypothetical protein
MAQKGMFESIKNATETKGGKLAVSSLIVMGALGLAGCAPNVSAEPQPTQTSVETPTPEKTYTPPVVEKMPTSLEKYEAMSYEEFATLPIQERLTYCSWLGRDIEDIADKWFNKTKNPLDKLPVASTSNTPQEKVILNTYMVRQPYVGHQNLTSYLDLPQSLKLMSCAFTDPSSRDATYWINAIEKATDAGYVGGPPQIYADENLFAAPEVIDYEEPLTNDDSGLEDQVVYASYHDGTQDVKVVYTTVPYTDYTGAERVAYPRNVLSGF